MHDFICIHIQQNEEHAKREMTDNQIHSDKFCIYRFQKNDSWICFDTDRWSLGQFCAIPSVKFLPDRFNCPLFLAFFNNAACTVFGSSGFLNPAFASKPGLLLNAIFWRFSDVSVSFCTKTRYRGLACFTDKTKLGCSFFSTLGSFDCNHQSKKNENADSERGIDPGGVLEFITGG